MKQSYETDDHIRLVRMAACKIINELDVTSMHLAFHIGGIKPVRLNVRLEPAIGWSKDEYHFQTDVGFIPDIVVHYFEMTPVQRQKYVERIEEEETIFGTRKFKVGDYQTVSELQKVSYSIILEAETNPRKLLGNTFKMGCYEAIKRAWERGQPRTEEKPRNKLILAVYEDVVAEGEQVHPVFDEVWRFSR